ncbi:MAG: DNA replication/repair protein RecF [Erysipelotrichaceae bacterium]|nr:DNA replication/repair protein RecF [Erysipelotrichaceae bacterium]
MKINRLQLKNYRNYENLDIQLSPSLNIFIGNNAQGKSNILESIFVLALTKSYMNIKDQFLIKNGENFSCIKAICSDGILENQLEIILTDNSKKLKVNHFEIKKYSDYISRIKVLIFSPYNVNFVKDGPNTRRKAINMVISQFSSTYIKLLQNYNAVLKKRNQFLKSIDCFKEYNRFYFDTLNERFCSLAVDIVLERYQFVTNINQFLSHIYKEITGYDNLRFQYISNVDLNDEKLKMLDDFKLKLSSMFEKEKKYGVTLAGPHRDDFSFLLDGKDLSLFGSQGQVRGAILALKLSEVLIFKEKDGDYPILLLDDVFSELDIEKRNRLVKYILDDVQTIITTTDIDMIDQSLVDKAKIFVVKDGKIIDDGKKECKNE